MSGSKFQIGQTVTHRGSLDAWWHMIHADVIDNETPVAATQRRRQYGSSLVRLFVVEQHQIECHVGVQYVYSCRTVTPGAIGSALLVLNEVELAELPPEAR